MSEDIKFSTSGFRAVIAEGLTAQTVQRLAFGISDHILENSFYGFEGSGYQKHCQEQGKKPKKPLVIIGYDTRFLSKQLAYVAANAFLANGIGVKMADEPLPTPVAEWNVLKEGAVGAVVITGSEADYHVCGLKWIAYYGGIANNEIVEDIEKRTPGPSAQVLKTSSTEFDHLNSAVVPTNALKKEYMSHLEHAPTLQAMGLSEPYQSLAEYNGTVLAGRLTERGAKFVTWDWDFHHTGLNQGHYYEGNYVDAKRDFAIRSGLMPDERQFTPEQLMEIYQQCSYICFSCSLSPEQERIIDEIQQ